MVYWHHSTAVQTRYFIYRIIAGERKRLEEEKMKLSALIGHWGLESGEIRQIQDCVWEVSGTYILKAYERLGDLERNVQIMKVLRSMGIPAAEVISTSEGTDYLYSDERCYMVTRKLPGAPVKDIKEVKKLACQMGQIIGRLHLAFQTCEEELDFWDNSLLSEMKGWVKDELNKNGWSIIAQSDYETAVSSLEHVYDRLPFQLIHRDVHFGNFLFQEGEFTGYIDFDLSQKNIRVFDLCYFLMGLLAMEEGHRPGKNEWLQIIAETVAGYESQITLTAVEKEAFPWVMENIELLFAAWSTGISDIRCAEDAVKLFHFVQENETAITEALKIVSV